MFGNKHGSMLMHTRYPASHLGGCARAQAYTQPFLDLFASPPKTAAEAVTLNQSETSLAGREVGGNGQRRRAIH